MAGWPAAATSPATSISRAWHGTGSRPAHPRGAALTFTVLGFTGLSDVAVLTSAILALLATLALSQIRSRQHIAAIAAGQRADPLALLKDQLPPDLDSQRAAASSYLFIRKSMTRLVHTGRDDIRKTIRAGGHVQMLLLELASLPRGERGRLDIRFCSFVLRISVNAFNLDHPQRRRCHVHPALRIPASR